MVSAIDDLIARAQSDPTVLGVILSGSPVRAGTSDGCTVRADWPPTPRAGRTTTTYEDCATRQHPPKVHVAGKNAGRDHCPPGPSTQVVFTDRARTSCTGHATATALAAHQR
jgi:hypothetical protein